jgi:hypothetical protein
VITPRDKGIPDREASVCGKDGERKVHGFTALVVAERALKWDILMGGCND